jgi:serine/threonine protein phosphatase PrpC
MKYTFASCINLGYGKNFDAFAHNRSVVSFCLSDGANSAPLSDLSAQLTCLELTNQNSISREKVLVTYKQLHQLLRERYPNSACTSAHLQLMNKKMLVSHCGDSLIEVYQTKCIGLPLIGKQRWSLDWQNTLDELSTGNGPSQLLGSNAYRQAHIEMLDIKRPVLILLSTDGLHRYTSLKQRLSQINYLNQNTPSEHDLEYICQTLTQTAMQAGSLDDISVVAIWCSPI